MEAAAEPEVHRLLEQADPEAARAARQVAIRGIALAVGEARSDRDVAAVRADELEQAAELDDRVLPVGVDAAAVAHTRARAASW